VNANSAMASHRNARALNTSREMLAKNHQNNISVHRARNRVASAHHSRKILRSFRPPLVGIGCA
jgi:hypothetical protein